MPHPQERFGKALARAGVYRFLSALLSYPDDATWSEVQGKSARETARALTFLRWKVKGLRELQKIIREMPREGLEAEYVTTFGHTAGGRLPPYEAAYGTQHLFQETQCLADVAGFYRAFGFEASETCRERPDHIAVELEFMHVLAVKEAYALRKQWTEQTALCREAEEKFLRDHLGRWAPSFLRHLRERTQAGLFEKVAGVTTACLKADCHSFNLPTRPGELEPIMNPAAREEPSFSCGVERLGEGPPCAFTPAEETTKGTHLKEGEQ